MVSQAIPGISKSDFRRLLVQQHELGEWDPVADDSNSLFTTLAMLHSGHKPGGKYDEELVRKIRRRAFELRYY